MHDNEKLERLKQQLHDITERQREVCQLINDFRTPLLTIRNGVQGSLKHLQTLLQAYDLACEQQLIKPSLRKSTRESLAATLNNLLPEFDVCNNDLNAMLALLMPKDNKAATPE